MFRNALRTKLCEVLRVDLDPAYDERVFGFLDNMIGPLFMAIGGFFYKIDADHVIQLLCYNISLYLVSTLFVILFICTLIFKELEITSLSVLLNFTVGTLMAMAIHIYTFFHRLEMAVLISQIINWVEFKPRPKSQSIFETFSFKFSRVYWGPLVWTMWAGYVFMIPVFDYMLNGRAYSLPFPLWFPFKTNNPLGYAAAYIFEIYAVHFFSSFIIACLPLFFLLCYAVLDEYDSLIDSIRSLHVDALAMYKLQLSERTNVSTNPATDEEYFDLYKDRVFQYCCERSLRQINIQHAVIIRMMKDVKNYLYTTVTAALTCGSIFVGPALCFAVIDIGDITLRVTFTAIGIMDFLIIWFICHLSQMLILKGEKVREELYFTNWCNWPEGMKRDLRLMLVRSLYPPHFSVAFLDIKADYITLTAVVNSTYTFINLVYAFTQ